MDGGGSGVGGHEERYALTESEFEVQAGFFFCFFFFSFVFEKDKGVTICASRSSMLALRLSQSPFCRVNRKKVSHSSKTISVFPSSRLVSCFLRLRLHTRNPHDLRVL